MTSESRASDGAEISIDRNDEVQRYELTVDGALAGTAVFHTKPGATVVTHTVVDPEYEGRGLGSRLAKAVVEDVIARGERVIPVCPFLAAYLDRHPEYADSVGYAND